MGGPGLRLALIMRGMRPARANRALRLRPPPLLFASMTTGASGWRPRLRYKHIRSLINLYPLNYPGRGYGARGYKYE